MDGWRERRDKCDNHRTVKRVMYTGHLPEQPVRIISVASAMPSWCRESRLARSTSFPLMIIIIMMKLTRY